MSAGREIQGWAHVRFHRLLEAGHPSSCSYCGVALVCPCSMERVRFGDGPHLIAPEDTSAFTVDHVIPRARGGSSRLENLTLACGLCNSRKGAS